MRLPTFLFAAASALGLADSAAAGYRDTSAPMNAVPTLDIQRYLGKWYEIARFPNRFERNCTAVTAEYTRNPDDTIHVLNTCRKGSPDGPVNVAEGKAEMVAPGKLKVNFVPWLPFVKGDYWVLFVDSDYSYAVVGEPTGKTGWILARKPELGPNKYDNAVSVLQSMGYDTSKLERVAHQAP
jgi:apolipoprotein D and lipocalin family protein